MTDNPFDIGFVEPEHEPEQVTETQRRHSGLVHHTAVIQGSDEWLQMRCGVLTASEMKHVITPKLKIADNDKTRAHAYELAFQRISNYVEPHYVSDAMLRGQEDEIYAREAYREHFAPVAEIGFITNDRLGFTLGYSPDAIVGSDGLIEVKSRGGKFHVQTIATDEVPEEYMIQLQTGLLVSERKWIDFISYCGGLPMFVKRVEPIKAFQDAIADAAIQFEDRVQDIMHNYRFTLAGMMKVIPTERRAYQEIVV